MTPETVVQIGQEALKTVALLTAPGLVAVLSVGLVIGLFQAATQINEQTLSFVPKMMALALTLFVAAPWMLGVLIDFSRGLIEQLPLLVG